ncbi:MAG: carboxypeptidase regulatory-like domain-containing protein [Myxococcaceae bacterium]
MSRPLFAALLAVSTAASAANDDVRQSAQRGLDFLAANTIAWQKQNNCYGCHVQAVTLEGLSVGRHNQYNVTQAQMSGVVDGILRLPGGARGPEGLYHSGYPRTARTFGASALARYDAYVDTKLTDDLLKVARQLLAYQQADGSVQGDHQSYPVTTGVMQATFQAMQTWRQSYARTADQVWLAPLAKAEKYVATTVQGWHGNPKGVYLQDVNYAVMGLVTAGAGKSETDVVTLTRYLEGLQKQDGGWGFGSESDAFATGQTVHALKLAGRTEEDGTVKRGLSWLVKHQAQDGGWGAAGSARAEAMWAVLGLVSVDVLSIAVKGIDDGQHVGSKHTLEVEAKDNQGTQVKKVELLVDDVSVKKADAPKLSYEWTTAELSSGQHTIDAVATNAKGQTSRRRLVVFAGNVFITQLGTRFSDEVTQVTFRDIAPEGGSMKLDISPDDGSGKAGKAIYSTTQTSTPGAMGFAWSGKDQAGKLQTGKRFVATVSFLDAKGAVKQTETTVFVHDSLEAQRARYAEIQGKIDLARDGNDAANADIELVNAKGEVVQRVRSNENGNYRFKSVDEGDYQVRVSKKGFNAPASKAVHAAPAAAPAEASMSLH